MSEGSQQLMPSMARHEGESVAVSLQAMPLTVINKMPTPGRSKFDIMSGERLRSSEMMSTYHEQGDR